MLIVADGSMYLADGPASCTKVNMKLQASDLGSQ